jgi:small-conductance mechanosensitive channel
MATLTHYLHYPVAILGSIAALLLGWMAHKLAHKYYAKRESDPAERYRKHQVVSTWVAVAATLVVVVLWARLLQHTGTFLGIVAAGLAVALKEPLLSIAGRIAIFAGKMYSVGDRIEIDQMKGDVIDIGFFYTRMMEIGSWIKADQASGRILQFANARVFGGTAVLNYTQNFAYIWDEVLMPITYDSNVQEMQRIMLRVGGDYTREFMAGAEEQLKAMQRFYLVPSVELKPAMYMKVTDNWVELTMRYVVEPKKRRTASSFIYGEIFKQIQGREDIAIASTTSDVTVHGAPRSSEEPGKPGEQKAA